MNGGLKRVLHPALAVALAAIVALGLASAVPRTTLAAQGHETEECNSTMTVCELVFNAYAGSNYVYRVIVFSSVDNNSPHTYRVLFDGYPRYSYFDEGGYTQPINYYVDPGRCIQGGMEGVPNGRTACWWTP